MQWHHPSFPYLYDTHVHTRQGSACGKNTGSEMALAYHAVGYSSMIIATQYLFTHKNTPSKVSDRLTFEGVFYSSQSFSL